MFRLKRASSLVLFLIAISQVQNQPIRLARRLRFRGDQTVAVNGTDLIQLTCVAQSSLARALCSNIIEVTCWKRELEEKIESCAVSQTVNGTSAELGSAISEKAIACVNNRDGNCYLSFSLNEAANLKSAFQNDQPNAQAGSSNGPKDARKNLGPAMILMIVCIGLLCLLAFVVICLPPLVFAFLWLKFIFCTDADDDEENIATQ